MNAVFINERFHHYKQHIYNNIILEPVCVLQMYSLPTDVYIVVCQYDASLSSLLDNQSPLKRIYVAKSIMNDLTLWRKTRLTVHLDMCSESSITVKKLLIIANLECFKIKSQITMVIRKSFSKLLILCLDGTNTLIYQIMIHLSHLPLF